MRGRRAFVILTLYLVLLGGFAWMVEFIGEASFNNNFGQCRLCLGVDRAGHLRRVDPARDPPGRLPGAGLHRRGDQPRTREADARAAGHDPDLLGGDRPGQAPERADLRLPADRGLDPAHGHRLRLRRRRTGGCGSRLHRPARDRARPRLVRAVLFQPRQAYPGGDRYLDLRRARRVRRLDLPAHLLAVLANDDNGQGRGPIAGRPPEVIAYVNPFLAQADSSSALDRGLRWRVLRRPHQHRSQRTRRRVLGLDQRRRSVPVPAPMVVRGHRATEKVGSWSRRTPAAPTSRHSAS